MPESDMGPPRFWRRILGRVLPARDREGLREELDRLYGTRAARDGRPAADRWYRREVLAFATHMAADGFSRAGALVAEGTMDGLRSWGQVARGLMHAPGFSAVAVITLAVGIGANATIFSLADRALLRPPPYPEPDRLVVLLDGWTTSLGSIQVLQEEMTSVDALGGAWDGRGMTLTGPDGETRRVTVAAVSPEYLQALRVVPTAGRLFRPEESRPGEGRVALVGYDFFQAHYGGDLGALGSPLSLDDKGYAVVGVLPRDFDLPSARNEVWIPAEVDASNPGALWGAGIYSVVARLAPGSTREQARIDLLRAGETVRLRNPLWTPNAGFWDEAVVATLQDSRGRGARSALLVLLGGVGVLLAVVCANLANLLLARGLSRSRDLAVRAALGAGRGRLARGQVAEALMLAGLGSALGLAFAAWGLGALRPFLPPELPGAGVAGVDGRVLLYTAGLALVTALAAAALPALRVGGGAPGALLKEGGRSGHSTGRRRTTRVLVATQMAAAVVLVTSAGLLARSLAALNRVDPGFEVAGRVAARVDLPAGLPAGADARAVYLETVHGAVAVESGLAGVAMASTIPFGSELENAAILIPGVTPDPNDLPVTYHHRVTPDYFSVMGIPVQAGRSFDAGDRPGTPLVAMVDRSFVDRFFPGEDPVGRVIRYPWRGAPDIRIVGVVGAVAHQDLALPVEPTVWVPLAQMGLGAVDHVVVTARATGDEGAALAALQRAVRGVDERMAVSEARSIADLVGGSLAGDRGLAVLLALFAGSTLVLGCVGVYGVSAFSVRARVREIGVRMTLGADPREIRRGILREGFLLAVPGGVAGVALAVPVARALEGLLFGVSALDPVSFAAAPVLLTLAAVAAVFPPARRATRVDPASILREE
jgi:predicted permease